MIKNYYHGLLFALFICMQSACSCLPGFDVERVEEGGFIANSAEHSTTFGFFQQDPETGDPSVLFQVNNGPLITYHGLGSEKDTKSYSSFYVKGKGFYFDDNLDGFPDRLLHVNGKTYNIKYTANER